MPYALVTRRPFAFTVLAVFVAWYAVGCAMLATWALGRGTSRWLPAALVAACAAAAGAAAAAGVWTLRPWAARAVEAWGAGVVLAFATLFLTVRPAPGEPRPWWALAAGVALFASVTWGLARYVRGHEPGAVARKRARR